MYFVKVFFLLLAVSHLNLASSSSDSSNKCRTVFSTDITEILKIPSGKKELPNYIETLKDILLQNNHSYLMKETAINYLGLIGINEQNLSAKIIEIMFKGFNGNNKEIQKKILLEVTRIATKFKEENQFVCDRLLELAKSYRSNYYISYLIVQRLQSLAVSYPDYSFTIFTKLLQLNFPRIDLDQIQKNLNNTVVQKDRHNPSVQHRMVSFFKKPLQKTIRTVNEKINPISSINQSLQSTFIETMVSIQLSSNPENQEHILDYLKTIQVNTSDNNLQEFVFKILADINFNKLKNLISHKSD